MRDIVSCFSENAIDVSHPSCSSFSHNACISPGLTPSVQNAVSCFYKIILSTQKQLLATVSWSKNHTNQGLSIKFGNDPSTSFKLGTHTRFFRKLKGNKLIESDTSKIEVFWDLSSAKYELGPEPVEWFYVLVMVDSEIGLVLGDIGEETLIKKFKTSSTSVAKTVIRVKRLQWNFRGNQTVFLDGLLVDLLWDVHDWFFNPGSGYAVFMFRTRSGMDSRLWLEEKLVQKEQERLEFSLLIYASKSP
ncbi:hypothetical protein NC651_023063 [Populus alba x Populus x berolinensis]|nr:hypothetical protein NC651_023063 [Populus alba x Populus x berolinensis]